MTSDNEDWASRSVIVAARSWASGSDSSVGLQSSMSCQKASSFMPASMPQRSDSPGSGSPVCCGCEKDAFAEQGELGSSEHLAFDHLDVIYAALDGAGVPACAQALEHGIPVLLQTGGEGMQSGQVRGADDHDPVFEVLTGAGF
jgi:hypothetical protein